MSEKKSLLEKAQAPSSWKPPEPPKTPLEALRRIAMTPSRPFPDAGAHSWEAFGRAVFTAWSDIQTIARAMLAKEPEAWQPIETVPESENLIIIGSYNARGHWCADIWSAERLKVARQRDKDGFYKDAPHLNWQPTHWMPLPVGPYDPKVGRPEPSPPTKDPTP